MQRQTLQKQLILKAVSELKNHPTAQQVFEYIAQKNPKISKATVYRNLRQMSENELLKDIGTLNGSTHYDHNMSEHHHFVCNECCNVFDIFEDFSPFYDKARKLANFSILSCNITFNGICENCINSHDMS